MKNLTKILVTLLVAVGLTGLIISADIHDYTAQEALNKVLKGNTLGIHAYTTNEVLSLVLNESDNSLKVALVGGTGSMDSLWLSTGTDSTLLFQGGDSLIFENDGGGVLFIADSAGVIYMPEIALFSANPTLQFKDTGGTDSDVNALMDVNLTDTGSGTEDVDVTLKQQIAGTLTTFLQADADGVITLGSATQNVIVKGDLTIDGNGLFMATGGVLDWNATDKMTHSANTMTVSGFTTWDMGAVATLDFDGATELTTGGTGNITLSPAGGGDVVLGGQRTTLTVGGGTNDDGIVFGSLGTATKGIDLSNSGLSGGSDYWFYGDADNYWTAEGTMYTTNWQTLNVGSSQRAIRAAPTNYNLQLYSQGYGDLALGVVANSSAMIGNRNKVGQWFGDGVSNGTTTITDVGGAAHGLSLAAGDMVHIQNSSTSADEGFYRIVSDDGTNVVVDRTLTGSQTNLTVSFYKDVIGFFATDGTNGQRIMNYSHQDKPLQIGGDVLAATGHSLGAEDVLIGGKLEVDGAAYVDDLLVVTGWAFFSGSNISIGNSLMRFKDNKILSMGTGDDAQFLWETADANANALILALPDGGETNVPVFVIGDQGATSIVNQDLGVFDGVTDPTLAIWDAAGGASKYISFKHDGTDGVISTGAGDIKLSPAGGSIIFSASNGKIVDTATSVSIYGGDTSGDDLKLYANSSNTYPYIELGGASTPILMIGAYDFRVRRNDATTNSVSTVLDLMHYGGTPVAGFGSDLTFSLEENDDTVREAAIIEAVWTDAGETTSADADIVFKTMLGDAAAAEKFRIASTGDITIGATDATAQLILPSSNDASTPTLAFGDGDTGFYEDADDKLYVSIGGYYHWRFGAYSLEGRETFSAALDGATSSATNPAHTFQGDTDTGIGRAGADNLSLIAGGVEGHRITEAAGAITHNLTGDAEFDDNVKLNGALFGKNNDIGNSSASQDISLNDGNFQEITLAVATTTITFTDEVASGNTSSITLVVKQDATGGRLITWDGAVKWAYGNAPLLSSGANDIDIFSFFTTDGGTTWYGVISAKEVS